MDLPKLDALYAGGTRDPDFRGKVIANLVATIRDLAAALEESPCQFVGADGIVRLAGYPYDCRTQEKTRDDMCDRCAALDRCQETWG